MSMGNKLWSFFAEDDGAGSMSRLLAFLSFGFVAYWVSHVVLHTHSIPDLHNPGYFLTAGNVPYISNKIHAGATAIFGSTPAAAVPPQAS